MARRHSTKLIAPFPSNINRTDFGNWLSGLTDGEGSFMLGKKNLGGKFFPHARFHIQLRKDDTDILESIQSYWQCGRIFSYDKHHKKLINANPYSVLQVYAATDLATIVVPHFDSFPLRAKKRRDFNIWREGVLLLYRIKKRKQIPRGYSLGHHPKWSPDELSYFNKLHDGIREVRKYVSIVQENEVPKPPEEKTLFDGLA